jgi:hypothetical protein
VRYFYSRNDENSGVSLTLSWQVLDPGADIEYLYRSHNTPFWLNDNKLTELGFDMRKINRDTKQNSLHLYDLSTVAILVLEYQGESYRKAMQLAELKLVELKKSVANDPGDENLSDRLERRENQLARDKIAASRLFAIDAGLDAQALLEKYPDQGNYLFVQGEIGLTWREDAIEGRIKQLLIQDVHVPLPFSKQISSYSTGGRYYDYNKEPIAPRYRVLLNIGKRFEPWVEAVTYKQ